MFRPKKFIKKPHIKLFFLTLKYKEQCLGQKSKRKTLKKPRKTRKIFDLKHEKSYIGHKKPNLRVCEVKGAKCSTGSV